jgi:hypothetical protein
MALPRREDAGAILVGAAGTGNESFQEQRRALTAAYSQALNGC